MKVLVSDRNKKVIAFLLAVLLTFSIFLGVAYIVASALNLQRGGSLLGISPEEGSETPEPYIEGDDIVRSVGVSAVGDESFSHFESVASREGAADERQMDLWGSGKLLNQFGNDSEFLLEVWVNASETNQFLHITAHVYDGSHIHSTPDHYMDREFVCNASVWADEFTGPDLWEIYVVGTYEPAGIGSGAQGFVDKFTFETDETFNSTWENQEFLVGDNETWLTDLKVDQLDLEGYSEIVACGYVANESSYSAFVHVWNQTAVNGPLVSESLVTWCDDTADLKPTALDIGQFDDAAVDGPKDLVVVGNHYTTSDVFGRVDLFSGTDYHPIDGYFGWNTSILNTPTTGHIYDVVIGDGDVDSDNELYVAGDMGGSAFLGIFNWTGGISNTEAYFSELFGYDSARYYEVELANVTGWDSQEMILFGAGHNDTSGEDHMLLQVWNYTGISTSDPLVGLQNSTGATGMDLIDNFCELRVSDGDGDGDGEFVLCASQVESGTRGRDDTVYGVTFDVEGPPGRLPPSPETDSRPPGRFPDHLYEGEAEEETGAYAQGRAETALGRLGWYLCISILLIAVGVVLGILRGQEWAILMLTILLGMWAIVTVISIFAPLYEVYLVARMDVFWAEITGGVWFW